MIKKLAEQLKRKNKKRGINITLGTVVGLLLSCATVIQATDEIIVGKDMYQDNKDYDFVVDGNQMGVTGTNNNIAGLYLKNGEMRDVIVNGRGINVSLTINDPSNYFASIIHIDGSILRDIVINGKIMGMVSGSSNSYSSYGIFINDSTLRDIVLNDQLQVPMSFTGFIRPNYGIYANSSSLRDIIINGYINSGSGTNETDNATTYGIYVNSSEMRDIISNGHMRTFLNNSYISSYGIYVNSSKMRNIINNGELTSRSYGNSHGIYINSSNLENVINNGFIEASGGSTDSSRRGMITGIYILDTKLRDIINNGTISSQGVNRDNGTGIYISSTSTEDITKLDNIINNGNILSYGEIEPNGVFLNKAEIRNIINSGKIKNVLTSSSKTGSGIKLNDITMEDMINSGTISSYNSNTSNVTNETIGILLAENVNIRNIINNGTISGNKNDKVRPEGYGIKNISNSIDINNLGVIFGNTNTIKGDNGKINNYGILAAEGSTIIDGSLAAENNYGLYISDTDGKVNIDGEKQGVVPIEITTGHDESGNEIKREMVVKNATIGADGKSTKSFIFTGAGENYNNSILNGKHETLKVSGSEEIKGSVINAYGTAVKFDTEGGELTLSGTIVNGGLDKINNIITGSNKGDTLILQSGTIAYKDGSTGTQNTIINGNIDMGEGNDTLVISSGTIVNGTLAGGAGNDTLNFGTASEMKSNSETGNGVNILNNISGFENININTNVTISNVTAGDVSGTQALKITDADKITIGKNGVLTLNLDPINPSSYPLKDNTGTISSTGGKLLFALNGLGNTSKIRLGKTSLDSSLVTENEAEYKEDVTLGVTSLLHSLERVEGVPSEIKITSKVDLPTSTPDDIAYEKLNKIYHSILSVDELGNFNVDDDEKLSTFLGYLNDIYAGNPYSYSSELSRKSMEMFRDIVVENIFRPETNKWMIHGGLTHIDGGTKDTYYGKGYYTYDIGSSAIESDTKITGAYMFGEYGISDTLTSGVVVGGNKLKSDLSNGSKVDGSAMYIGGYVKKYTGNLKLTAGAGFQYGDYDADRLGVNGVASDPAKSVMKYSDNYNDISYDIYLNGRYSNPIGDNLFLEPYGTLSYTYIKQDGADEGNKTLAIETDSKSFDYTSAKVGVDIKKVIPHEKGKSTLSAGVSYTKIINGAGEENITGKFKGGKDFDILVAHKNEHNIGLNAKYALELENGILFDVKGSYAVERDSNNNSGKNKTKGEWIVGAGLGYKF